jgi:hypothetical protein
MGSGDNSTNLLLWPRASGIVLLSNISKSLGNAQATDRKYKIEIKIGKPLPPSYEKLKERYETDNRLRCLTVFILGRSPSQS